MYRQMPKEIVYLNKMADVASSTSKGHASLYYAWANLSRHYYNIQNRDSLIYWSHKIDSLAAAKNEVPDALFDARGFICQMDLWDGNYELAMNGAISLYNYARDTKSEYGLICCNENLGLIYQEIHRDSDAIVAYREVSIYYRNEVTIRNSRCNTWETSSNLIYEPIISPRPRNY